MLRNKLRAVSSKQALMADQTCQSSLFGSPRFKAFTTKCLPVTESLKSPTSILHNKPLFPFGFHSNQPKSPKRFVSPETLEPKGIGLAIADTLDDKPIENNTCLETRSNKVVFGTKLRVEVPNREMELSEEYTCVKSHGPNPKTTHIYDNSVVKSCCSVLEEAKCAGKSDNFLRFCHTCKKNLQQKIDIYIYIYRGERGFCSQECRYQEMILHGEEDC
ncbi:hypothetical protein GQ457_15G023100 [Hibiscus cannabinus]